MMEMNISERCRAVDASVKKIRAIGRPNVQTDSMNSQPKWLPFYYDLLARKVLDCQNFLGRVRMKTMWRCATKFGVDLDDELLGDLANVAPHFMLGVGCSYEHAIFLMIEVDALLPAGTRMSVMNRLWDHKFAVVEDRQHKPWVLDPWNEIESGKSYGDGEYIFDDPIRNRMISVYFSSGSGLLRKVLNSYLGWESFRQSMRWGRENLRLNLQDLRSDSRTYVHRLGFPLYGGLC